MLHQKKFSSKGEMMKKKSDISSQQKKKHKGKSQGGIGPGTSVDGPQDACPRKYARLS